MTAEFKIAMPTSVSVSFRNSQQRASEGQVDFPDERRFGVWRQQNARFSDSPPPSAGFLFSLTQRVITTRGPEQEYFLIDRTFYFARPDLIGARLAV